MNYNSMDELETVKISFSQLEQMYRLLSKSTLVEATISNNQIVGQDTIACAKTKDGWHILSIKIR